jgi:hypothetical protein
MVLSLLLQIGMLPPMARDFHRIPPLAAGGESAGGAADGRDCAARVYWSGEPAGDAWAGANCGSAAGMAGGWIDGGGGGDARAPGPHRTTLEDLRLSCSPRGAGVAGTRDGGADVRPTERSARAAARARRT